MILYMYEKTPEISTSLEITRQQAEQLDNSTEELSPIAPINPEEKEQQRQSRLKEVWKKLREATSEAWGKPVFTEKETVVSPIENIKYYPDRMYRCIGKNGYQDFVTTGSVRSRDNRKYLDVSFNLGKPSSLYLQKESGDYILEALPDAANFEPKTHPFHGTPMLDIDYRGIQKGELTKDSKIRIFEKQQTGEYAVVFDNIGDQALLE